MLYRLKRWLSPDLAIDLGTANTLIAVQGAGVVLDEPSVVALQKGTRKVLGRGTAVGKLARQMLGRTPDSITTVKPIQDGAITDFELCEAMMRYFISKAAKTTPRIRQNMVIAVTGGITPVERRAVFNPGNMGLRVSERSSKRVLRRKPENLLADVETWCHSSNHTKNVCCAQAQLYIYCVGMACELD